MSLSLNQPNVGKYPLVFASGDWAKQANGSVVVSCGETYVLVTACMSKKLSSSGYFPLMVEYQEKTYAAGRIPGGYIKREGRPKDHEILTARLIDRPIRPLFPYGMRNEVQVVAMVLSSDGENDPDVLAINGASLALNISDIPFKKAIAAVRVAKVDDQFVINPTYQDREKSSMDFVVVASLEEIVMLEGGFDQASDEEVIEAIKFAHPYAKKIIELQNQFKEKCFKPKKEVQLPNKNEELHSKISQKVSSKLEDLYGKVKKEEREKAIEEVMASLIEEFCPQDSEITPEEVNETFYVIEENFMREKILKQNKRPDGRKLDQIRAISCEVGALPRTHGSGVFTRGQTQALAVTTLGSDSDEQTIESLEGRKSEHFMLHYSFPSFSVGEVKPMRGLSRRDIGHGALAHRAVLSVVPSKEEFPYTVRIVSEILESNGSSSMATVCASSLSLMDAGIPIKTPVAGIAMGLVREGSEYKILTDIAGVEDHYGDMDLKVAGTKDGVTAIQLDMKVEGISYDIIKDGLKEAKKAREFILEKMTAELSKPRSGLSRYAPKIKTVKIEPDKIGTVIGPGGKMIRRLSKDYDVSIDIDDERSLVSVVATDEAKLNEAIQQIINITKDSEVGDVYPAKVVKLMNFGAFCEFAPGKQGLVHVSEISDQYVKNVEDILKEGDPVTVKVIGIDPHGRINLSIKQVPKE